MGELCHVLKTNAAITPVKEAHYSTCIALAKSAVTTNLAGSVVDMGDDSEEGSADLDKVVQLVLSERLATHCNFGRSAYVPKASGGEGGKIGKIIKQKRPKINSKGGVWITLKNILKKTTIIQDRLSAPSMSWNLGQAKVSEEGHNVTVDSGDHSCLSLVLASDNLHRVWRC